MSAVFDPFGKTVLSGSWDGNVRLWDAATGQPLKNFAGHKGYIRSAVFTPDGRFLVSGAGDNSIRVWDTATGKETRRLLLDAKAGAPKGYRGRQVLAMRLAPDGMTLVSQSTGFRGPGQNCFFQAWDLKSGKELWQKEAGDHLFASFSPDGQSYTSRQQSGLEVRKLPGGRLLADFRTTDSFGYGGFAFSRDGAILAGTTFQLQSGIGYRSATNYRFHLGELTSGKLLLSIPCGFSHCCAFAPDDRTVAAAFGDKSVRLFNVADGKELWRLPEQEYRVDCLAFSPDGKRLVTGAMDGTMYVWDLGVSWQQTGFPAAPLTAAEVQACWAALSSADAAKAHKAIWKLVAAPREALGLFRNRLQPAPRPDQGKLQKLLADLDSDRYQAREAASRALAGMGELAEPAMQRLLSRQPSGEVRRRIDKLLAAPVPPAAGESLRRLRAVRVLEQIATPSARAVLAHLAAGAEGARETLAAHAALQRLQGKGSP